MNTQTLIPVLQILEVMRKNIQNKSFLRSLKAIARKIKNLMKKQVLDKTVFDNLRKLRNKNLPNSYNKVIDNIILPIMNIFKFIDHDSKNPYLKTVFLGKAYTIDVTAPKAASFA